MTVDEEFYEANRTRIEGLSSGAGRYIDDHPDFSLEATPIDGRINVNWIGGRLTASDYLDIIIDATGENLSPDDAQELADIANSVRTQSAAIAILSVRALATMEYVAARAAGSREKEVEETTVAEARPIEFLGFDRGTWEQSEAKGPNQEPIELTRIILSGVEHYGTVRQDRIEVEDQGVTSRVHITKISDKTPRIHLSIELEDLPLITRAVQVLGMGEEYGRVIKIMLGTFVDEDALDEELGEIWQEFQGRAQEEEITPLLDEVRTFALARKQSIELASVIDMHKPTDEQFGKLEAIIANLA